jgi:hypothetical protein
MGDRAMQNNESVQAAASENAPTDIVASADTGARAPSGFSG